MPLAVTALIIPATALAQGPITVEADVGFPVEYVGYSDINMASDAGLDLLRGRVRGAAKRLCIDEAVRQLEPVLEGRACFSGAVADAERQINLVVAALDRGERFASNASIAVQAGGAGS